MHPGRMDKTDFLNRFGDVFEHSPWIAEQAWESGLGAHQDTAAGLHQAFSDVINAADHDRQLSLLRAHPQLVCGMAADQELTDASQTEQRGAGLDRCSAEEFAEFRWLNESYRARFGFPFIMAVKGSSRREILQTFKRRLANQWEEEFQEAIRQVIRIGLFRMESKFE